MKPDALLDSNVLIAMLAEAHEHHVPSLGLLIGERRSEYAVAAHSYAEAYSTLTRRGERAPFRFSAEEAWAALESVRAVTVLVGLTPAQSFDAIRAYAQGGGIGARLYDLLIGEAAIVHEIPVIVTWNIGHMRSLFPSLTIATPKEFGAGPQSAGAAGTDG
ncbi:PIN domain-containing protein [Sphingobium sp. AS12]|uniref:type II toxin-antitoxin system VapC family toxin n=1 Tax=Sphingobium sp. AS12 TaxID=2849495 RepID=UPI001C318150|nr:PIN domain-containing protein [Sphingobium sp. AS12]MBV2149876.1 PIN domain-containing protein [Sphingobium sp. AS12]